MEILEKQLSYGGKYFEPGVYEISNDEYHSSAGISRSAIMEFRKSPEHYWDACLNPIKKPKVNKKALDIGQAVHCYILEPELFNRDYVVMHKYTGKGAKNQTLEFKQKNSGKIFITQSNLRDVESMANSIKKHATAKDLIDNAKYEKSIFWIDEESGLLCKARPDIWHSNMIVDLKTTACASEKSFQFSVTEYGYYLQAAMCLDAVKQVALEEHDNFIFVAVETARPFSAVSYPLANEAILQGRSDYKSALLQLKECLETNNWPGYQDQEISIKRYALTI